ncbi:hypothetical protein OB905_13165 [Halobacteria archaeon AArc-dxtr1]|nr:hypothetical protein [Halobacteria archaeon AArc-dxtr1]
MMRKRKQPERPDPEEQHRRSQEQTQHSAATQTAAQEAAKSTPDLSELQSKEFIETAFEPDVNRGDGVPGFENNRLEERYAAEFGRHAGLGNITREEWEDRKHLNRARAILALQEYRRPNGLGSMCREDIRKAWTDEDEPLPKRDDDLSREVRAMFDEKTNLESLSIGAKGFDGLTKIHAVTYSQNEGGSSGKSGLLSRMTGGLMGGN